MNDRIRGNKPWPDVDDVMWYEGRVVTVISIDGPASASLPLQGHPMTIQFVDNTTQSFVYGHQLTPIEK